MDGSPTNKRRKDVGDGVGARWLEDDNTSKQSPVSDGVTQKKEFRRPICLASMMAHETTLSPNINSNILHLESQKMKGASPSNYFGLL
jgi:hypothetical protein